MGFLNFFYIWFVKDNYYFIPLRVFLHQSLLMGFLRSLNDNTSPHISRTLLNILADLNNVIVWMVLILPLISDSSSLFSKPFGTIPSAPITIGITVILVFHCIFSSQARSKYFSIFSQSFIFTLWFVRMVSSLLLLLSLLWWVFHTSIS